MKSKMTAEGVKSCKKTGELTNIYMDFYAWYLFWTERFCGMIVSQFVDVIFVNWENVYSTWVNLDDITLEPDYAPSCNSNENIIENIKKPRKT